MTRVADISPEEVGLMHLLEPELPEKNVGLQFQLPGSEEIIYAEGEVVRQWTDMDAPGKGSRIRFTLMTERHRQLIRQYVTRHLSKAEKSP